MTCDSKINLYGNIYNKYVYVEIGIKCIRVSF